MLRVAVVLWFLSQLFVAGCAAVVTPAEGGLHPDAIAESDGTVFTDGDNGTHDAEASEDVGSSPICRRQSAVTISTNNYYHNGVRYRNEVVVGEFFADADATYRCERHVEGNCRLTVFTYRAYEYWPGVSAGDLFIRWGNNPPNMVPRSRDPMWLTYRLIVVEGDPVWTVGDRIRVWATGDVVPAFSSEVVFPPMVQVRGLEPEVERMSVRVRDGLTVEWGETWAPYLGISIHAYYGTIEQGEYKYLRCLFPGRLGRGVVPPSMLERLVGADRVRMGIYSMDLRVLNLGGHEVEVRAIHVTTLLGLVLE